MDLMEDISNMTDGGSVALLNAEQSMVYVLPTILGLSSENHIIISHTKYVLILRFTTIV